MAIMELEDLRSARLVCLLANAYRDDKKRPRPYRLEEFLVLKQERAQQSPEDMLLVMRAFNDTLGGAVIIDG